MVLADEDGDDAADQRLKHERANPKELPSTSLPGAAAATELAAARQERQSQQKQQQLKPLEGPLDLPFTISLPATYEK